jgi:hypothetical protein
MAPLATQARRRATRTRSTAPSTGQEKYGNCGFELIAHFLENPTAPLDTSCASDAPPIDFSSGLAALSRPWFGVDDPYDGEPAPADGGASP